MPSYDDTSAIHRIRQAMEADPKISRRAAIVREVGEDSLRRIEMKMRREDQSRTNDTELPIDVLRRYFGEAEISTVEGKVIEKADEMLWLSVDGVDENFELGFEDAREGHVLRFTLIGNRPVAMQNLSTGKVVYASVSTPLEHLWVLIGMIASFTIGAIGLIAGLWPLVLQFPVLMAIVLHRSSVDWRMMRRIRSREDQEAALSGASPDSTARQSPSL